jgi:DNA ligase 1
MLTTSKMRPMLLTPYCEARLRQEERWYLSEKYDGWRCMYIDGVFYTRSGNVIECMPSRIVDATAELADKVGGVLDGELWAGYGCFGDVASCLTSDDTRLRFMIFDAPRASDAFEDRLGFLEDEIIDAADVDGDSAIAIVPQTLFKASEVAAMDDEYQKIIKKGGEGIVLRPATQTYDEGARLATFMKRKPVEFTEAIVVDRWRDPVKHPEGYCASLICRIEKKEFKVPFKNMMSTAPQKGDIVRVKHNAWTSTGLPKFAVYAGVRPKADLDDTLLNAFEAMNVKTEKIQKPGEDIKTVKIKCPLKPGESIKVPSDKVIGTFYTVKMSRAGDCVYCDCPAWKYQKLNPLKRVCKHTLRILDGST